MHKYFYSLIRQYLAIIILPQDVVVEVDPMNSLLVGAIPQGKITFHNTSEEITLATNFRKDSLIPFKSIFEARPDYILVGTTIHYDRDIQALLASIHKACHPETRLVLTYYSSLWRPLVKLASKIGLRRKLPESNWLAHEDINNLLQLEGFELIKLDNKILIPFYIPLISRIFNGYLAQLPIFRNFCLLNIVIARPLINEKLIKALLPSVSIVIPARNEAGNIDNIIKRIPLLGPNDEIIFIEGNSQDNTWQAIKDAHARYGSQRRILLAQQNGKGKGDAVRKGFEIATNEILMILDADMTVRPEDLPKFYHAIKDGKGEFINGTRLVYPMRKNSMRFLNLVGNKFFAVAFSFVLGQKFKDTLCGTKVISRSNYLKLASNRSFFGDFDPFGDFDLIFGAARMGLKIIEVPICYQERVYGETNISRWRHGAILLAMLIFSAKRMKFL
jgi:hypothetical protein